MPSVPTPVRRPPWRSAAALAVVAVVAVLLPVGRVVAQPAPAPAPAVETGRLAGPDRFATAVAIAREQFPAGAGTVHLARSDVPFDALAGGTLTAGPILLVPPCGPVPAVVLDEVGRLRPGRVLALGGPTAVCDDVLAQAATAAAGDATAGETVEEVAAADAVRAFVTAVGSGDLDAAYALLSERSRQAVGGREGLEDLRSELGEGFGAYGSAPDLVTDPVTVASPVASGGREWLVVVQLSGTVAQEGPPAFAATAVAASVVAGEARLELFQRVAEGQAVIFDPPSGTAIPARPTLTVRYPTGAVDAVSLVLDGAPVASTRTGAALGSTSEEHTPPAPLTPGRHVFSATLVGDAGIQTLAADYAVEGTAGDGR